MFPSMVEDRGHYPASELAAQRVRELPYIAVASGGADQSPQTRQIAFAAKLNNFQIIKMAEYVVRQLGDGSFMPEPNCETRSIRSQTEHIKRRLIFKARTQTSARALEGIADRGSVAFLLIGSIGAEQVSELILDRRLRSCPKYECGVPFNMAMPVVATGKQMIERGRIGMRGSLADWRIRSLAPTV